MDDEIQTNIKPGTDETRTFAKAGWGACSTIYRRNRKILGIAGKVMQLTKFSWQWTAINKRKYCNRI